MAEVESIALVKNQRDRLQAAIDEDHAYLRRHGYTIDPESLWRRLEEAYECGELRLAQLPPRPHDDVSARAVELPPPPLVEVEDALARLQNPEQRSKYLIGLRARMDDFERATEIASPDASTFTGDYPTLVILVRDEMKTVQAVVPPARRTPLPSESEVQATKEVRRIKARGAFQSFKEILHSPFSPGEDISALLNRATDPLMDLTRDLSASSSADQGIPPPSVRISPERVAAPTQLFLIKGTSAPVYVAAYLEAVRKEPSLIRGPLACLRKAAGLEGEHDPARVVRDAIERATGWSCPVRDADAFVRAMFTSIGEDLP